MVHHSASTFETEARSLEQEAYAEFAVARDDFCPAHGWCVDDLLCVTSSGHQLHASAFKRTLASSRVARGRRTHHLRHTAACLARVGRRSRDRPGVDGSRVDRDDQSLPGLPGDSAYRAGLARSNDGRRRRG